MFRTVQQWNSAAAVGAAVVVWTVAVSGQAAKPAAPKVGAVKPADHGR